MSNQLKHNLKNIYYYYNHVFEVSIFTRTTTCQFNDNKIFYELLCYLVSKLVVRHRLFYINTLRQMGCLKITNITT